MGTLAVTPKYHGELMVLYAPTRVEAVVDGAPPIGVGRSRLFSLEPGKTTRVPYEVGRFFLEHMAYSGVVRVSQTEDENGITYDVAQAKLDSDEALKVQDEKVFKQYISDAVDDFVKRNKPVPQPPPRIMEIIKRRGYDLKKFGITPIGWEDPDKDGRVSQLEAKLKTVESLLEKQADDKAYIHKLEQQVLELQTKPEKG